MSDGTSRVGGWVQVWSGKRFYPLDPRPEEVNIMDIAHALAMKCRYGGHCSEFYSLAEHSVLMSQKASPENALWALLHDAGEAYLADVPRPVKPNLPGWKTLEADVMAAVCTKFGLPLAEPAEVKALDTAILRDEKERLMRGGEDWDWLPPGLGVKIECLPPFEAKHAFMRRFIELTVDRRVEGWSHV
jgi:hypothetical protein